MSTPAWRVTGRYYETCNCDLVCPCIVTQMMAKPTTGSCTFAMGFHIEQGKYGELSLDGLGFILVGFTPEEMSKGNWSAGVIVDQRANPEQRNAIVALASGAAGGPMAGLSGLITNFAGVESAGITFDQDGMKWSVKASPFVSMSAKPAMGIDPRSAEPLQLANTGHPAASTVTLAHPVQSQVNAFGLAWNDTTGKNNGQFAPFTWANT